MDVLELKNISSCANGINIIDNISMKFTSGNIYAITGENASGKSMFVKILSGLYSFSGHIYLNNKPVNSKHGNKLLSQNIASVYQQTNLQKNLTVLENIFIGRYSYFKHRSGLVNKNKIAERFIELIELTHFPISATSKVSQLSYVEKRMVEVMRALVLDPKILVFDTLFCNVNDNEKCLFYDLLCELKKRNKIILYFSHKIKEALLISDYISVISKGKIIYLSETSMATKSKVIKALCTELDKNRYPHINKSKGEMVLSCKNLYTDEIENINFSLFKGEILGITGLVGSGKSSILKVISGTQKSKLGEITLLKNNAKIKSPNSAYRNGIGFMTGTNSKDLVPGFSPQKNITLSNIRSVSDFGFVNDKKEASVRNVAYSNFSIKNEKNIATYKLSAGTQKKLCIAKILFAKTNILVLNEPTLGIDSASKSDVYNLLIDYVSKGNSIILISSDFSEVSGLADRAIIIREGKLIAELLHNDLSKEKILSKIYN